MIRGIYNAANGMENAVQAHEIVAQNLAYSNVPGYRQRGLIFNVPDAATNASAKAPAKKATPFIDFRPGTLQFTNSPLDFAVDGDAFFTLQGPNGTVYTRNGAMHLDSKGQLVSQAGYPLMGVGGTLTIPSDAGQINVSKDGTIKAGDATIGQIKLTRFSNQQKLEPVGPTLFRATNEAGAAASTNSSVVQGYREASNVQPAEAMVAMISGARYHEAAQRALRAIGDAIGMNTRPQNA